MPSRPELNLGVHLGTIRLGHKNLHHFIFPQTRDRPRRLFWQRVTVPWRRHHNAQRVSLIDEPDLNALL